MKTHEFVGHRALAAMSKASLSHAVRCALHRQRPALYVSAGVLLAGMLVSIDAAAAPVSFPPVIELSSLDGTNGFVLQGISEDDHSGAAVSSAGDINGDGIDDLLIGAARADPNSMSLAGETYVVFGRAALAAQQSQRHRQRDQ
jgi:hypothetical protein